MSDELNNRPNSRTKTTQTVSDHRYSVGQLVRLTQIWPMISANNADAFSITALLPPARGEPQYRIRNECESHERVTTQDMLKPVLVSEKWQKDTSLIAKTFR